MPGAGDMLRPQSAAEVQERLADANAERRRITLRGGGSKTGFGGAVDTGDVLDLSALAGVERYEPGELVLRAGAGTRVDDIAALLADQDQMLAFEPPDLGPLMGEPPGLSTLGGMLAAGLSGPRRISAGAARDHFLGFDAVAGRGVAFKAGGPVVKNVTGYDLPKLMAGSWGALAALTSVTLKVMPRPKTAMTMVIGGLDLRGAAEVMSQAMGGPWSVSGAAHMPAPLNRRSPLMSDGSATLLRLEGFSPSVQARMASLRAAFRGAGGIDLYGDAPTEAVWRWIRDVEPFWGHERRVWRLSVPPADGWRLADAARGAECLHDWAGGQIWVCAEDDFNADPLLEQVKAIGGHARLVRGQGPAAAHPLSDLTARVKIAFDPNGVLSAARLTTLTGA